MRRASEWRPISGSLSILLLLFTAILAESSAWAVAYSGWQVALGSVARVVLFSIGVYIFFYTLDGPRAAQPHPMVFARLVFWLGVGGALFACIDFYFQWPAPAGFAPQYIRVAQNYVRRAQGVFYEASTLGNLCACFVVMILVACFSPGKEDRLYSRPILTIGCLTLFAALMLSYSRTSLLTVIIAAGAFALLRGPKIQRALIAMCAGLGLAAVALRFALPGFAANYWWRLGASIQYLTSSPNGVTSGRLATWNTLTGFLAQHPWRLLFGIGYKTIPYTNLFGRRLAADNTYLSLLVETGLAGLIVFLLLNAAILRTAFRAARSANGNASFFGTWIFCFWCGEIVQMLSGDLITYWRVLPLYFWVLAIAAREAAA